MERLYTPAEAAPLIGLKSAGQVRREVKAGRLKAKFRPTLDPRKRPDGTPRNRVPRILIPASAIEQHIAALPDAGPQMKPAVVNRNRAPRGLREEIAQCIQYV